METREQKLLRAKQKLSSFQTQRSATPGGQGLGQGQTETPIKPDTLPGSFFSPAPTPFTSHVGNSQTTRPNVAPGVSSGLSSSNNFSSPIRPVPSSLFGYESVAPSPFSGSFPVDAEVDTNYEHAGSLSLFGPPPPKTEESEMDDLIGQVRKSFETPNRPPPFTSLETPPSNYMTPVPLGTQARPGPLRYETLPPPPPPMFVPPPTTFSNIPPTSASSSEPAPATSGDELAFRKSVLASLTRLSGSLGVRDRLPDFNQLAERIRGGSEEQISAEISEFIGRVTEALEAATADGQLTSKADVEALRAEKDELAKEVEVAGLRTAELEAASEELTRRGGELEAREAELATLRAQLVSTSSETSSLKQTIEQKESELEDANLKLVELSERTFESGELEELRARADTAIATANEAVALAEAKDEEVAELKGRLGELGMELERARELQAELSAARVDTALIPAAEADSAELAQLRTDLEQSRLDLEAARDDAEVAQSTLRDFQGVYAALVEEKAARERESESLRTDLEARDGRVKEVEGLLAEAGRRSPAVDGAADQIRAEYEARVSELQGKLEAAEEKLANMEAQYAEKERQLDEAAARADIPEIAEPEPEPVLTEDSVRLAEVEEELALANDENARLRARLAEVGGTTPVSEVGVSPLNTIPVVVATEEDIPTRDDSLSASPLAPESAAPSKPGFGKKPWSEKFKALQSALIEAQEVARRQEEQIRQLGNINTPHSEPSSRSMPSSPERKMSFSSDLARQQSKRLGQLLAENASLKRAKTQLESRKDEEIRTLRERLAGSADGTGQSSNDSDLLEQLAQKDALITQFRADLENAQKMAKLLVADSEQRIAELTGKLADVSGQLEMQQGDAGAGQSLDFATGQPDDGLVDELKARIEALLEEKRILESELVEAREAQQVALRFKDDLVGQLAESERMRQELQSSVDDLRRRVEASSPLEISVQLEATIDSLKAEVRELGDQRRQLEFDLAEARAAAEAVTSLKEEMTAGFEGEVAQLNEQLDQLQTQRELLESQLRDANASLEAALADRDEVAARLADAEAGRAQLEEVSRELQARVDGLAVSDAFNDIGPESPLAMAESRVAELDGAVASAASREAELREALDGTRTQVERLESNLETARARETDLQRAVETAELSRRETESALLQRTASFEGEKRQLLDKLDSSEARFVELNLEKQSLAELLAAERDNTTQLARSLNESHARLEAEGRRLAEVQQLLERAQQQRIQAEQDYEQLAASFRNVEHELQITEARSPALSGATLNEGAWEELGGLVRENVSRGWKVLDELQTVFDAFGIDRTKLTNDIAASGETLESALQRSLDHASSEIQHLRAQLLRATYIAETTTQRITELEREVAESRQTAVLEGLVSELRFEKEGLDSQLASLGTHNRTLQREIGELQHQLTSLGQSSSQAEEQRREVAFFRQNLEEANHRIAELREERDAMKRRVQDVETGRKTDAEQINTLLGDLRDLTERLADAKIERQADRQKFEQMRADLEQRIHEQVVQIERYDKQLAESRHRLLTETEKHDRELLRVAGESRAMEEKYRALGRVQSDVAMLREENASLRTQLETEKSDALAMEESVTLLSAENLKLKAASLALEQAKVNLSEELFELNRSHKELVSSFEQTRLHGEQLAAINAQLANDIGLARESQERSEREVMELRQLAAKLQTSQPNPSSLREAFRDGQRAAEAENDRLRAEVERLHDEIDRAVRDRESVRRDRDSVLSRLKREMNEIDGVLRKREDTIRTFVEHRRKFDDTPGKPPRDDTRFGTRSLRSY